MLSNRLKRVILKRKIQKSLKIKNSDTGERSGKVAFVIDAENFKDKLKLLSLFKKAGFSEENVTVILCDYPKDLPEGVTKVLNAEDINFNAVFKAQEIRKFTQTKLDILIAYFSENSLTAALLVAKSEASVKIGKKPDTFNLFDVEIDTDEISVFQEEAFKYLKILKNTD